MHARRPFAILVWILAAGGAALASAAAPPPSAAPAFEAAAAPAGGPEVKLQAFVDRGAIAPGGAVRVLLEGTVTDGWHLYHPVLISAGLPTVITVEAPAGVSVGDWRFPQPSLDSFQGEEYLGLAHQFACIAELKADGAIATEGPIKLVIKLKGLACKTSCVPVEAQTTLELPVAASAAEKTHAERFAIAEKALAPPFSGAPHVKSIVLTPKHTAIPAGSKSEIALRVGLADGTRIVARDATGKDLTPARLFLGDVGGVMLDFDGQRWSDAEERDVAGVGSVGVHGGDLVVRLPIEVAGDAEPGPMRVPAIFRYQALGDDGKLQSPVMSVGEVAYEIVAKGQAAVANRAFDAVDKIPLARAGGPSGGGGGASVWYAYLFAFLGGMILNIMPCVLPVISLKIFGFVNQAGESRARIFSLGLVYTLGVLASFLPIAILMGFFGASWGSLLQNSIFVTVLTVAVFAFGLSFLGVYEIALPGSAQTAVSAAGHREGYGGAFLNGIFATALATPCVGPALGSAVGVLATFPPLTAAGGVMVVGLGLAFPYVLLTAFPGWLKLLPRPGAWMETFKQLVGFVMMAVVVWLLWILKHQVTDLELFAALMYLVVVGLACWIIGRVGLVANWGQTLSGWFTAAAVLAVGGLGCWWWFSVSPYELKWEKWEPRLAERMAAEGRTVYVDYTATWCMTCQQNKNAVLNTELIRDAFKDKRVFAIKADFTKEAPEMLAEIRGHGRNGVPLNVIYPAGAADKPIILPEILTQRVVIDALEKAGASKAGERKIASGE